MQTDLIAERYRRFARTEARGQSCLYEAFALSTVQSTALLQRLAALPRPKQQPNLLFAATRQAAGMPAAEEDFARHCLDHWADVECVLLARSTQTNEPARCACLLPVLSAIEGPLAILEVGAAAGLCLLIDRYGYDYGDRVILPKAKGAPQFQCRVSGPAPLPASPPEIVWRAGIDLNPLNVRDEADMNWLRTLVWPEQMSRRRQLDAAIELARQEPPVVHQGNLLDHTAALAATAPRDATLVIFHSAVLAYLEPSERQAFVGMVTALDAHWVANEGAGILPDVQHAPTSPAAPGAFFLSLDGRALAQTGPHGQCLAWLR